MKIPTQPQRSSASPVVSWLIPFLLCALVLAFATSGTLFAQTTTGTVYGSVTDDSGAFVPGAPIIITNVDSGETHTTKSVDSGGYSFPALPPGHYRAEVHEPGFKDEIQRNIHLDANQDVHVNFLLHVGAATETVTVDADVTLVDTRESQLGSTIDQTSLEDLPTLNRTAYSLVQTLPGVTNYQPAAQIGDVTGAQFSVNGQRVNENSFYLDGGFDSEVYRSGGNLIPNPDALQEFRMLTSNFDAEFGRSPGGVLNMITRSGTNSFHGEAYDYLRNAALNASSRFNPVVTPLRQNQFGGTFGGPVLHNKLFYFLSYEGLRIRTTQYVNSDSGIVTPTAAEILGNFVNAPNIPTALLPNVSCLTVKYVICPGLIDKVAQNILSVIPVADPVTGLTPEQSASAPTNADQGLARLDYQLTTAHKLSFTFFESQGSDINPTSGSNNILDYGGLSEKDGQTNLVLADNWTVSASKLNSLRFFYTLNHYAGQPRSNYTWSSFNSPIVPGGTLVAPPIINTKSYWDMTSTGSATRAQLVMGSMDTFIWSKAHHEIKAGGSFFWTRYAETGPFLSEGNLAFTGTTTGNAMADFLEGHANTFEQNNGVYHRYHSPDPALFVQDNWHLANRLTLNLGMRWEVYYPFSGQSNLSTFAPNVKSVRFPAAPLGLLAAGDPGVPDGVRLVSYKDFAPRVGFAWDVFGNGKTGLHGSYGIFYSTSEETLTGNLEQMPFLLDVTLNKTTNLSTPYSALAAGDPFPYTSNASNPVFSAGATIVGLPPKSSSVPYVQQYNLTLEQQFGPNWGSRIAYVGNASRKFYLLRDQNAPIYSPTGLTTTAGLNARRPYEPTPATYTFGQIGEIDPASNGSYNSLQLTLKHRMAHGFSFQASYVWSKILDDVSTDPNNGTTIGVVNSNDIGYDYGKSGLDVPQTFVATYIWKLPSVKWGGLIGREVLDGWQANGITTITTGSPFTVNSGVDSNKDGSTTSDRPNVVGNPSLGGGRSRAQKIAQFFNPAAFADPAAGVPYGNEQRDMLIGPGYIDTDLSAFKRFTLARETSLEFRGELFNIFNHVNLANPASSLTSPTDGQITSIVGGPRIVQFGLKVLF